jgi:hypothetical protein
MEGGIMADIRASSFGGIPKGDTSDRPSSPTIGDTYYNGQIEALEIYNGTTWKVAKSEGFPPDAPTIASVTDSSTSSVYSSTAGTLTVVFVPAPTGGTATQFNAYTTEGGHSGFTVSGSTVVITGLTPGTAYTVYGDARNGSGVSTNTANASPVTPTTLPEAPTIGTATISGNDLVAAWTLGSNGGKTLSSITVTPYLNGLTAQLSQTAETTSSTSLAFQLTSGSNYTFKVSVTNANGNSPDSSASNSVTAPNISFTTDWLVIAGGGAGGHTSSGGGGGAGGYRTSAGTSGANSSAESSQTIATNTNYLVTVGAGSPASSGVRPANGGDSVFNTITSTGGGCGGNYQGTPNGTPSSGGSGGGGAGNGASGIAGGASGTANQGSSGGTNGNLPYFGGSGGGAGAAGGNQGAVGGAGLSSSITGSSVSYAGGGSTGEQAANSFGGGGAVTDKNGAANKGGGGGSNGGAGGSGVVILRYPDTRTITIGVGLTGTESAASGGYKRATITNGSGNVSFS